MADTKSQAARRRRARRRSAQRAVEECLWALCGWRRWVAEQDGALQGDAATMAETLRGALLWISGQAAEGPADVAVARLLDQFSEAAP